MVDTAGAQGAEQILITGPPGGGKSTVARLVAAAFDHSVHIEADVVRESIVGGSEELVFPFSDGLVEQFALQREIVVDWAQRMSAAGYVAIIDDAPVPPPPRFAEQYARLLAQPTVWPVILRADGEVIRDRIRARSGPFDDFLVGMVDHALAMLDEFDQSVWHIVDSTDLDAEQTAAAVVAIVRGGASPQPG